MPPKRKASVSQIADGPTPRKRRTYSTVAKLSSSSPSRNPQSEGERAPSPPTIASPIPQPHEFGSPTRKASDMRLTRSQTKASGVAHSTPPTSTRKASDKHLTRPQTKVSAAVYSEPTTPTRKTRDQRLTRSQTKVSAVVHSTPPSRDPLTDSEDVQSEDGRVLLPTRKVTNGRRSKKAPSKPSQLPRVFVEIVSPAPRTPKLLTPKTIANLASPTPTRSRVTRKLSPSPPLRTSPTKAPAAKRIRPLRPLTLDNDGVSTPSRGSSKYPPSCLQAQKRAILHALHHPKTVVFDREDEHGEPSANAAALQELKALLTGTVERSEGNSCLLIGPRGSGKSRVIIYSSNVGAV